MATAKKSTAKKAVAKKSEAKKATAKKPAAKKNSRKANASNRVTHVVFVIDRSGSMSGLEKATVDGFNEQLNTLKLAAKGKNAGEYYLSAIKFDTQIEWMFNKTSVENVNPIGLNDFQPRGGTALRDSQYVAIQALEKEIDTGDTAFLLITISDGGENSSKDISQQALSAKIKELEAKGNWTFTYMLANQDIQQFANTYGVSINNVAAYQSTNVGTAQAYGAMSGSLSSYATSRSTGAKGVRNFYSGTTTTLVDPNATPTIDSALLNLANQAKFTTSRSH